MTPEKEGRDSWEVEAAANGESWTPLGEANDASSTGVDEPEDTDPEEPT